MTFFKTFLTTTALLSAAGMALANDDQLYKAPPPDDAAFIRLLDVAAPQTVFGVGIDNKEGFAYRAVSAAKADGAVAGQFYAAVTGQDGELIIIEEPARDDTSKVHLFLVNLSGAPVRVELDGRDVQVIGDTAVNASGVRAVNPVAATLNVVAEDGTVLGSFDVALRRGQNLTFVARDGAAEVIENSFGTNIKG